MSAFKLNFLNNFAEVVGQLRQLGMEVGAIPPSSSIQFIIYIYIYVCIFHLFASLHKFQFFVNLSEKDKMSNELITNLELLACCKCHLFFANGTSHHTCLPPLMPFILIISLMTH